jgi:hypothetical protein
MLKLTAYDTQPDEPESLLFPVEAVRQLGELRRRTPGRQDVARHTRCAEEALERVEADFRRLRAIVEEDDRPRAA